MNPTTHTNLSELITVLFDEFLAAYGDEDLAAAATAASINEMLISAPAEMREEAA